MAEYIEREAAIKRFNFAVLDCLGMEPAIRAEDIIKALESIPAADVRPVVLCKDCKWCHAGYCEKYDDLIPFGCANKPWEDWFCADGKKREES